jgi:hypothetical protein
MKLKRANDLHGVTKAFWDTRKEYSFGLVEKIRYI